MSTSNLNVNGELINNVSVVSAGGTLFDTIFNETLSTIILYSFSALQHSKKKWEIYSSKVANEASCTFHIQ